MTLTLTSWPTTPKTLTLSARYTDLVGRVPADTSTVTAQVPSIVSLYQPQIQQPSGTFYQAANVIAGYTFFVKNDGIAPVTYHMEESVSAPFSIHTNVPNDTLTVQPGQTGHYWVQIRSPIDNGKTGEITVRASYTFDGQTVQSIVNATVVTHTTGPAVHIANTAGPTQPVSGDSGTTTFKITNIGSQTLEVTFTPTVANCNGMALNCRYAPRPGGLDVTLAPSTSTNVTVLFDIAPPSSGFNWAMEDVVVNGKPNTPSAAIQRGGSVLLERTTVAEGVDITPDALPVPVSPNATGRTWPFYIRNVGLTAAEFDWTVSCAGPGGGASSVTCAGAQGRTRLLDRDQVDTVVATFNTTGNLSALGYVTLLASKVGNSSIQATGSITVNLSTGTNAIEVTTASVNPGPVIARNQCLTIAAGSDAAYECGELRLVHALPATTTMNKTRAPTLIYNSAHATGHGIIAADVKVGSTITPSSLTATLKIRKTFDTTTVVNETRSIPWELGWNDDQWRRVAVQYNAATSSLVDDDKQAGLFKYTLEVKSGNDPDVVARDSGFVVIVDRSNSVFGAGWWLDGLERIVMLPDPETRLWIGGDGSARVYAKGPIPTRADTTFWLAQSLERPDSLIQIGVGGAYRRLLPNGAYVEFTAAGRHAKTVNTLGHATQFFWSGDLARVDSIYLPVPVGGPVRKYGFAYTSGLLTSVTAPVGPSGPRVTNLLRTSAELAIVDPGLPAVRYVAEPDGRIVRRTNRLQDPTRFDFDSVSRTLAATVLDVSRMSPQPDSIKTKFCAGEAAGLAVCAPPDSSARARTLLDGPRPVPDTTAFRITNLGAPRVIINALGDSTIIQRNDLRFPALPTAAVAPNGHRVDAFYTDRGLVDFTRDINPLGDGANAETRYTWDGKWNRATKIVSPKGVEDHFQYNTTTGLREWQQHGSNSAGRTQFRYYPATRLVRAVEITGVTPAVRPESISYDNLGNVELTRSASRGWTKYIRTAVGGDSIVVSAIAPTDTVPGSGATGRLLSVTTYDAAGRPSTIATTGETPSLWGANEQTITVVNGYDDESQLTSVTRTSAPDPNQIGTMVDSTIYDAAGRVTDQVSPDLHREQFWYDPAGNLLRRKLRTGEIDTMTYDLLNRLETRVTPQKVTPVDTLFPRYPLNHATGVLILRDVAEFVYEPLTGHLQSADNGDAKITRTYYPNGLLKTERQQIRTYAGADFSKHDYLLSYEYDLDGRRKKLTRPDQVAVSFDYDYPGKTGDLLSVTNGANAFSFERDLAGRLEATVRDGVYRETNTYDQAGRRATRTETHLIYPQAGPLHADQFRYDLRDKLTWLQTRFDSITTAYSGLGAVRSWERRNLISGNVADEQIRTDALANTVTSEAGTLDVTYGGLTVHSYKDPNGTSDHTGRLKSRIAAGSTGWTASYDAAGNQKRTLLNTPTHGVAEQSYYGADGKLRVFNRVTAYNPNVSVPPADQMPTFEEYRYDALGRRVLKRVRRNDCGTCFSAIERYVWDGDALLGEMRYPGRDGILLDSLEVDTGFIKVTDTVDVIEGPARVRTRYDPQYGRAWYLHGLGIDRPLLVERQFYGQDSLTYYLDPSPNDPPGNGLAPGNHSIALHYDHAGRIDEGTIGSGPAATMGLKVEWPGYDVRMFGGRITRHGEPTSWVGGLIDGMRDGSGLIYLRNRYYDPSSGRFTQEDPIGLAGGMNLYGFAGGDPINFTDPFGLSECPEGQSDIGGGICAVLLEFPGIGPAGRGLVKAVQGLVTAGRRGATLIRHAQNLRGYLQHLTPSDLRGAVREMKGLQSGGEHLQEVREAVGGLRGFIKDVNQALSNPELSVAERAIYSKLMGMASRALDNAEAALRTVK